MRQEIFANTARSSRIIQTHPSLSLRPVPSEAPCAFSRAVLVESHGCVERRATHSVISLAVHIAVIAALLILPLLTSTAPRFAPFTQDMVVLAVPSPPSKDATARHSYTRALTKRVFSSMRFLPPALSSRRILPGLSYPLPPMDASIRVFQLNGGHRERSWWNITGRSCSTGVSCAAGKSSRREPGRRRSRIPALSTS